MLTTNPYQSTDACAPSTTSWLRLLGLTIGPIGVLVGLLPGFAATSACAQLCWGALTASPHGGTLRPMAFPVQIAMTTGIGFIICMPIALACGYFAARLGCPALGNAAKSAGYTFVAPILIGFIGFYVFAMIADYRGVPTD